MFVITGRVTWLRDWEVVIPPDEPVELNVFISKLTK